MNNFSYFLSCGLYVNIFYVKYLTQDSTKLKITCILYDLSYFVKIIHIFTDSARGSQTFACHCRFHSSGQPYIHEKKISLNKESNNFAIVSFQMLKLPQSLHAA